MVARNPSKNRTRTIATKRMGVVGNPDSNDELTENLVHLEGPDYTVGLSQALESDQLSYRKRVDGTEMKTEGVDGDEEEKDPLAETLKKSQVTESGLVGKPKAEVLRVSF